MKFRLLGLVLVGIAAAGFVVVAGYAGATAPVSSTQWELLLSLMCVPAAAVGVPLLAFGPALFRRTRAAPSRRRSFWDES